MSIKNLYPRTVGAKAAKYLTRHDADETRAVIALSAEDMSAYRASQAGVTDRTAPGEWVPVTEVLTDSLVQVRAASCGLRCVCDMEVKA